ncbi:GNAT family N-acetyltransferase [Horticoccus luteus]|uniref:GNAT family N-acetyltransferase n=1 Tax=Horticoccus luteus TaxID=2862869 RepID=A0A8F9XG73_9BACT|nr:GNAT family N-acetyltransferase [Horticoccus luteus]QYM77920.1 GNAT family N-acetyltransferase [Horticoccus luteus]
MSPPAFSLRPAIEADYPWLWQLKRDTMRGYVENTWGSWDEVAQEAFFRRNFSPATVNVITTGHHDVGLLELVHRPHEIFLANIQIAPAHQSRGLGAAVVRTVQDEAAACGLPLCLQVLKVNPARRFYERLGFTVTSETLSHWFMEWRA